MKMPTLCERKRTGCLVCRAKRKKCDERKPVCLSCAKKSEQCVWPNNWKEPQTADAFAYADTSKTVVPGCSKRDQRTSSNATRPQAEFTSSTESPEHASLQPMSELASQKTSLERTYFRGKGFRDSPKLLHHPLVVPSSVQLDSDDFQVLFQHFISRSMPSMSADDVDTEIYVSLLVPLGLTDDLVLKCMLALSSLQYMLYNPTNSKAIKLSNTCYSRAISAMRDRVALSSTESQNDQTESLCSASILLALTETSRGDSGTNHVDFASHLLQSMSPSLRRSVDQRLYKHLLRICVFLRIESSTEEPPSLLTPAKLRKQTDMQILGAQLWEAESRAQTLLQSEERGLFQSPFITGLLTIPHLGRLQNADCVKQLSNQEISAQLAAIEMQIMSWAPPLPNTSLKVRQVWTLWRLAMLLLLYDSPVAGNFWQASKRNDCFNGFMQELKLIPKGHGSFGLLMWPIMIAGSCAQLPEHQKLIQDHLDHCCCSLATRMPALIADMLKLTWESQPTDHGMDESPEAVNEFTIDPMFLFTATSSSAKESSAASLFSASPSPTDDSKQDELGRKPLSEQEVG
ncbi:uncharacterized protein CTRU02_201468 [Colletotrichum truncatum]|uniref:Uncharacterized protein n=1 Tax=Colletotrichum truncatum TaxID=5467 RepID=A0ACC3ZHI2_COLTU|nr:uncharacterized protein CTRU02_14339 [Colletotrichum truncatum]KAF6782300.1 hypothetical protein CTRU02_14339 [Colletotrichum truncatum]